MRIASDANYVYAAWQVGDSHLTAGARGSSPATWPSILADDSVALHVSAGGRRVALVVSAAGAYAWLSDGKPVPFFSMKFAPVLRGTLDRVDDKDDGFDVEMALPWTSLGLPDGAAPDSGTPVSACLVVTKAGAPPTVFPSGADVTAPDTWPVVNGSAPGALVLRPRQTTPIVDGNVSPAEWPEPAVQFAVPDPIPERTAPVLPLRWEPLIESDRAVPIPTAADDTMAAERHVLARFWPGLNADLLKRSAPPRGVLDPSGVFTPIDHAAIGYGPWSSSDRVGWQRLQLTGMAQAGIDTAWTVMGPDGDPMAPFDTKALTVLATARRELLREGDTAPALAPWIESMPATGNPVDLANESGRSTLLSTLVRWLKAIPPSERRHLRVPLGDGTVAAVPVMLSRAASWTNTDSDWAQDIRIRLAREHAALAAGATLWFVGSADFPAGAQLDSRIGGDDSRLLVREVRPGSQAPFVPRRFGETFKAAWDAAKDAHWVVVDSWNDANAATDIAPSRQYGDGYVGLNRLFRTTLASSRFASAPIWTGDADLPRRVRPGQLFPIDFPVRNQGTRPLAAAEVKLEYRWWQAGKVVADGANIGQPTGPLAPGVSSSVRLGIATVGAGAQPLAPGAYDLEIVVRHPGGAIRKIRPVVVSEIDSVEITETSLPTLVQAGGSIPALVKLRLSAPEAIAAGKCRLVWQILDHSGTKVLAAGQEIPSRSIPSGTWVQIPVVIKTIAPDNAPIVPAFPEQQAQDPAAPASHRIRWALLRDDGPALEGSLDESLVVYPPLETARIEVVALPNEKVLPADKSARVRVRITNTTPRRWDKGWVSLTGRWFQSDGFPAQLIAALPSTPLPRELAAGESLEIDIDVRTPGRAGRYVLGVFALRPPDQFLALSPITGTSDSAFVPVDIAGGNAVTVDLGSWFDTDAVSWEPLPRDGDIDGSGATLPGEWFPADRFGAGVGAPAYPSGYYTDIASDIVRNTVFRFGPADDGKRNAVAARGQSLTVPKGKYVTLHLVAATTGAKSVEASVVLRYQNGKTTTITRRIRAFREPVGPTEAIALRFPRLRTPGSDIAETVALQHVVIPVGPDAELVSIQIPDKPEIKIFAMTLDR